MRIALVGLGGMGTTHYLNYLHIADAQVVAAVGKSEQDRARAAQWGLHLRNPIRRGTSTRTTAPGTSFA